MSPTNSPRSPVRWILTSVLEAGSGNRSMWPARGSSGPTVIMVGMVRPARAPAGSYRKEAWYSCHQSGPARNMSTTLSWSTSAEGMSTLRRASGVRRYQGQNKSMSRRIAHALTRWDPSQRGSREGV